MLNREELAEHACLRCTGRLFVEHRPAPYAADEWTCLQCGYTRWLEPAESEGGEGHGVAAAVAVSALNEEKIAA